MQPPDAAGVDLQDPARADRAADARRHRRDRHQLGRREARLPVWNRDQTLESAIRMSAVWVFQQFATAIGRSASSSTCARFSYGSATFEHDVTDFWLNGDLQISPLEQVAFLRRMFYVRPAGRPRPCRHGESGSDDAAREVRECGGRARRSRCAGRPAPSSASRAATARERRAGQLAGRRARERRPAVRVRQPRAGAAGARTTTSGADLAVRVPAIASSTFAAIASAAGAAREPRSWSSSGRRASRRSASTRRTRIPDREGSAVSRRSRPSTRATAAKSWR